VVTIHGRRIGVTVAVAAVVLVVATAASWGGIFGSHASAASLTKPSEHDITLAFAGDSTTAKPNSWLHQLHDKRIHVVGGYAHSGYTSEQVLRNIRHTRADVLVVMVGINDFHFADTDHVATAVADVNAIVAKVGALRAIISAVAPSDITRWHRDGADSQKLQTELNKALQRDAHKHHWTWTDPWASIRVKATGAYANGMTIDGIHPVTAGYVIAEKSLDTTIRRVAKNLPASR
jgi:lysophospholipase L1-like esterase